MPLPSTSLPPRRRRRPIEPVSASQSLVDYPEAAGLALFPMTWFAPAAHHQRQGSLDEQRPDTPIEFPILRADGYRMSMIFISYNRKNKDTAQRLSKDIESLGHDVWLDQELSGGQAWWDKILEMVRDCDTFVFLLDQDSLESTACKREFGYADELGKPVLPVLVGAGVSTNLLPPALSRLQFVDYINHDRETALALAKALMRMPSATALPDPLPAPPDAPVSYLGSLTQKVDIAQDLNYEEQSALLLDLRRSLRTSESEADARVLLGRLRKRPDLLAKIAEEIDRLMEDATRIAPTPPPPKDPQPEPARVTGKPPPGGWKQVLKKIDWRDRLLGAFVGAVVAGMIGGVMAAIYEPTNIAIPTLIVGSFGLVPGFITGSSWRLIKGAIVGASLGFFSWSLLDSSSEAIAMAGWFGVPLGATAGALFALLITKRPKRP